MNRRQLLSALPGAVLTSTATAAAAPSPKPEHQAALQGAVAAARPLFDPHSAHVDGRVWLSEDARVDTQARIRLALLPILTDVSTLAADLVRALPSIGNEQDDEYLRDFLADTLTEAFCEGLNDAQSEA